MFERRNQSILTPHYSALVAHDDDLVKDGEDDDDEVFTIARRDHALEDEGANLADTDLVPSANAAAVAEPLISSEDLSKRKLKMATSKKLNLKNRPAPEKLVFDEEGNATNFYESGIQAEQGAGAEAARREFVERERQQMREADKIDRAVAREAKKEKKRKRKEREREVSTDLLGLIRCPTLTRRPWHRQLTATTRQMGLLLS
jgi:ATP-dependent RNA helicase DDX10/DBP4